MKVQVLTGVEEMVMKAGKSAGKTFRYQTIGVQYPGKRFPVEDRMFLGRDDAPLALGLYELDLAKCVYAGTYDRMSIRLEPAAFKPIAAAAAARTGT